MLAHIFSKSVIVFSCCVTDNTIWFINVFIHTFNLTHIHTQRHKTYPMRLRLKKTEIENISNLFLGLEKTEFQSQEIWCHRYYHPGHFSFLGAEGSPLFSLGQVAYPFSLEGQLHPVSWNFWMRKECPKAWKNQCPKACLWGWIFQLPIRAWYGLLQCFSNFNGLTVPWGPC